MANKRTIDIEDLEIQVRGISANLLLIRNFINGENDTPSLEQRSILLDSIVNHLDRIADDLYYFAPSVVTVKEERGV